MMGPMQTAIFGCVWNEDYKLLPYTPKIINNTSLDVLRTMGYGNPKYFSANVYEKQIMPLWTKWIINAFGMYNQTYSFWRIDSMDSVPVHTVQCDEYMREKNASSEFVNVTFMMLEDWAPGQYFEIDNVPYTKWVKGTWFRCSSIAKFGYSNIGTTPWYVLCVHGMSIYTGTLDGLQYYNLIDIPADGRVAHPFIQHCVIPAIDDHTPTGQMVYFGNSRIKELEKINHTPQGREYLNKHGLKIHLFEPICSYSSTQTENTIYGTKHTQGFYSEFTGDIDPAVLRAEELDSILEYADKNKLTRVTVATGEYNIAKFYPYYGNRLHLVTNDLFLKTQKKIKDVNPNPEFNFNKKFLSLNWRYTNHRHMISTYMAQFSGYYSWYFKCMPEHLGSHQQFDFESWKHRHPKHYQRLLDNAQYINNVGPLAVDKTDATANWISPGTPVPIWPQVVGINCGTTPALFNGTENTLEPYYRDIFVDVVTESRFAQPTGNFSEKTFQPMQYRKPFVLVAPPYTLEYVKSYGFKTFSDYWDESYDNEEDHENRLVKIFDVVDFINNKSIEELREMYRDMQLILEHNVQVFEQVFATPTYRLEDR